MPLDGAHSSTYSKPNRNSLLTRIKSLGRNQGGSDSIPSDNSSNSKRNNRLSWHFDSSPLAEKDKKLKKQSSVPFYSLRTPPATPSTASLNSRYRQNLHHSSISLGSSNGSSSNLLNFPPTPTSASSSSPSTPRFHSSQSSRNNPPSPLYPQQRGGGSGNGSSSGQTEPEHHPLKAYIQFGNTQQSLSSNQYHHLHPNHPKNQARLKRHYTAHYSAALARNHKSKQLQKQQLYPQHYYIHAGTMPGHKFVTFGPDRHDRKGSVSSQHTISGSNTGNSGSSSSAGSANRKNNVSSSTAPSGNSSNTVLSSATAAKLVRDLNAYEDENFAIHIRTSTYETPFNARRQSTSSAMAMTPTTASKPKLGRKGSHGLLDVRNAFAGDNSSASKSSSSASSSPTLRTGPSIGTSNGGSVCTSDCISATAPVSIPGITCFPSTVAAAAAAAAANGTNPKVSPRGDASSPTSAIAAAAGVVPCRTIVCEKSQALTLTGQALRLAPIHALKAAAFLYEHIHCARAQSINFAIPWQSLESRYHSTITTLKDYQDMVMGDIGKALEMMTEIVEQEHRPFGHPDNRERDTKQMFGPRSFVAVYPPESRSDTRSRLTSPTTSKHHNHLTTGYQEFCGSSFGSLLNSPSSPATPLHHSGLGSPSPFSDSSSSSTLDLHSSSSSSAGSHANYNFGGASGGNGGGYDFGIGGASRRRSKSSGKFLSVPYATNTHSRLYQQRQSKDSAASGSGSNLSRNTNHNNIKNRRLSMGSFWKVGGSGSSQGDNSSSHQGNFSSSGDTLQDTDEKSICGSTISFGGNGSGISSQRRRRSESESNLMIFPNNTTLQSKDAYLSDTLPRQTQVPLQQQNPKGEVLASLQKFLNVLIKPVKFGSSNDSLSSGGNGSGGAGGNTDEGNSPVGNGSMFGGRNNGSKTRDLEAAWREDIQKRRRSLLAWCVRRFIALFRYSLTTENYSMAPDFGHIYNLFIAIPDLKNEEGQPYPPVTETDGYFEQRLSLSKKKYSTPVPTIKGISKRFGLLNSDGEDPNALLSTQHHHGNNHHHLSTVGTCPGSATGSKSYRFSVTTPDGTLPAGHGSGLQSQVRTCSNAKDTVSIAAAAASGGAAITLVSSPTDSSIASHVSTSSALSSVSSAANTSASRESSESNGTATTASTDEYSSDDMSTSLTVQNQQQKEHLKDDTSSIGSKKSHATRPSLRIDTRTTRLLQQQHRQQEQQKQQQKQQQAQQQPHQAEGQLQQSQEDTQKQQPQQTSTRTHNNKPLQNHFVQHQLMMQQQQYPYGLDQLTTHQRQGSTASKLDTYTVHNHAAATVHARWSFYGGIGIGNTSGHDNHGLNGFDNVEYFGLRELSIWEPFFDRVTRLESDLSNLLSERSVYQFLRRFHINKSGMAQLSSSKKSEMLCVLDLIERCVLERRDNDQCQTWFRMSSSATAVKQLADMGIHDFMATYEGKNLIEEVNPVTLTGYFKRLLKEAGGLFCREVIELVVEIVSPTSLTLDGETESWFCKSIDIVSKRIVQRLMLMDLDRAEVLYRLTAVLAKILRHSNRDLELESVALTKMIQVTELESISELATLGKWNGYWSCIISGDKEHQSRD
ncbi:hypothetical protein BGW42_007342 [Actinomortierella wolfii]|nr:hypothetical protein BGW42_007342 [Actinomortierella wolfii]